MDGFIPICIEKENREQLFDYILEKFPANQNIGFAINRNRMILFMI